MERMLKRSFSFTRRLTTERSFVSFFKAGFNCTINNVDCNITFNEKNEVICKSSCDLLYPITAKDVVTYLAAKTFDCPSPFNNLRIRIKQSLLLRRSFDTGSTTTLFPLLENASASIGEKRHVRILIPQGPGWSQPDFGNCFCGSLNSPPPYGGWDVSQRLCITVNGRFDSGISFEYDSIRYIVYIVSNGMNDTNQCMAIETIDAINPDEAQRMALKIISAIGFFTSAYSFGSLFLFDADTSQFISYNGCVIPAASSKFKMTSLNPYMYFTESDLRRMKREQLKDASQDPRIKIEGDPEPLLRLRGMLKPVEARHMARLLLFMESDLFMRPFHLLQTLATNLSTAIVFVRLSVYATCLEMCKKWVQCDIAGEGMIPQQDSFAERECRIPNGYKKEFFLDIHRALKKISSAMGKEDFRNLKMRLSNAFTKRIPNETTLKRPFEYLGLNISSERDKKTFSLRNFIAHGEKTIIADFDPKDSSKYFDESEETCFGFHSLIWRLIMVAIDYHGICRDLPRLNRLNRDGEGNDCSPISIEF